LIIYLVNSILWTLC